MENVKKKNRDEKQEEKKNYFQIFSKNSFNIFILINLKIYKLL